MPPKSHKHGQNGIKERTQWVLIMNDKILQTSHDEAGRPTLCRLRHPSSGQPAMFWLSHRDNIIYEMLQFKEDHRSWFIGDTVQSDGSLYITSHMDPTYLVLPYLIKSSKSGRAMPLDQIIEDEDFPDSHKLSQLEASMELSRIADVKGTEDLKAYKYNEESTLAWLQLKVQKVAAKLESNQCQLSGAQVSTYVRSSKGTLNSKDNCVRFAHGLVSEYLPSSLSSALKSRMGIPDPVVHEKPSMENAPLTKKSKSEKVEPLEDYSHGKQGAQKKTPAQKLSAAQKKLNQVDKSGMKSITSFFKVK